MRLVDRVPSPYPEEVSSDFFYKLLIFNSDTSEARLYNALVDILQYPNTLYDLSNGERVAETWKSADKNNARHWTKELFQCSVVAAALATRSAGRGGQVPREIAELLDFTALLSWNMGNRAFIFVYDALLDANFPGTAFHMAMIGDSIILLEGLDNPTMFRHKGDKWPFIVPGFVVGIMNGETWLDGDGAVQGLQDFVLI